MKIELTHEEGQRVVSVLRSLHGGAMLDDVATKIDDQINGLVDWAAIRADEEIAEKAFARHEAAVEQSITHLIDVLKPGVRVQISDTISPAYARNLFGVVVGRPGLSKHRRTKVRLETDHLGGEHRARLARFEHPDGTIHFPANALKVVA